MYAILSRAEVEASDAVITCIVPICHRFISLLFDQGSTYSYVSTHFDADIDHMCEPLDIPICVSTPVGKSLVVDRVYQSCIVRFLGGETQEDLIF